MHAINNFEEDIIVLGLKPSNRCLNRGIGRFNEKRGGKATMKTETGVMQPLTKEC